MNDSRRQRPSERARRRGERERARERALSEMAAGKCAARGEREEEKERECVLCVEAARTARRQDRSAPCIPICVSGLQ